MNSMQEFNSLSSQQTLQFACEFASRLVGGECIELVGDLGVGKTVFAKGIAMGLGVEDVVTSPTFTLHNMYSGRLNLNHFDFYRITNTEEAEALGVVDYFVLNDSVSIIEWGSNIVELLPTERYVVDIKIMEDNSRKIVVYKV